MFYEVDALLSVDENGIVISKGQKDVWMARLHEWLRTPSGSVYGLPHWGNPMEEFKHEPIGSETSHLVEVAIEGRLVTKLGEDLPGLNIESIRCEALSMDELQISFFAHGGGTSVIMKKKQEES